MEIDNRVTGKTRLIGVIGNPIEHSISPQLHNTICRELGLELVYVPFKVEKDSLESVIKGLRALNFVGFNVTIPYKNEVMQYLDGISEEALLMGAVNTVKIIDGRLYGYNTDAEGFSRTFKEETGAEFKDKCITIIGAGGAARSLAVKMALEGAKSINIVNRTISRAQEIAEIVNNNVNNTVRTFGSDNKTINEIYCESDIIVNTTSIGMYPDVDKSPIEENLSFRKSQIFYDVVYNPIKTIFLAHAESNGCKAVNGLGMLYYQGIYAFEIWTGIRLPVELNKKIFEAFLNILRK